MGIDTPPQPLEKSTIKYFDFPIPEMPSSNSFGNIGLMVNQHMDPRVAIAGTEQLVGLARPNDGPTAFDGGPICLQPKESFAVHYDLHGIVHVLGVGGASAHIQKVPGPEITTVFGNLFFHR